jgi:hypothetical protein
MALLFFLRGWEHTSTVGRREAGSMCLQYRAPPDVNQRENHARYILRLGPLAQLVEDGLRLGALL